MLLLAFDFDEGDGKEPSPLDESDEEEDDLTVSAEIVLPDEDFPLSLLLVFPQDELFVGGCNKLLTFLGDLERLDLKNFANFLDLLLLGDFVNISGEGICKGCGEVGGVGVVWPLLGLSLSFVVVAVVEFLGKVLAFSFWLDS